MKNRDTMRNFVIDRTKFEAKNVVPDPTILANFVKRIVKFGDIFNT